MQNHSFLSNVSYFILQAEVEVERIIRAVLTLDQVSRCQDNTQNLRVLFSSSITAKKAAVEKIIFCIIKDTNYYAAPKGFWLLFSKRIDDSDRLLSKDLQLAWEICRVILQTFNRVKLFLFVRLKSYSIAPGEGLSRKGDRGHSEFL